MYSLDVLFSQIGTCLLFHVQLNCCCLSCIQISQEAGKVVWYFHLFKNFPVCCHPRKGFSVVNEAKSDIFLEFSSFLYNPMGVDNLRSGSFAFSKSSFYIRKFSIHILLKPNLKDFEHDLASMWNEYNCAVVWTFSDIALLWHWNENWTFPVLWPLLSFPNLLEYWMQHFNTIIF